MATNGYNEGPMKNCISEAIRDFGDESSSLDIIFVSFAGDEIEVSNDLESIKWSDSEKGAAFCFRDDGKVLIRFIDENLQKHKQIILEDGYRICVEDWEGMSLCLYRNKENIIPYPTNREDFPTSLLMLWGDNKEKWTNEGQDT